MPKLEDLVSAVYSEIESLKKDLSAKIEAHQKKLDKVTAKENELDAKKEELVEREKVLSQKEQEIEVRWSKIRREDQVEQMRMEVLRDMEKVKKERKAIDDQVAENNFKLNQIKEKEQALSVREQNYKEELKKEFAYNVIGLK